MDSGTGTRLTASLVPAAGALWLELRSAEAPAGRWRKQLDCAWMRRIGRWAYRQSLADCDGLDHPFAPHHLDPASLARVIARVLSQV